MEDMKIDYENLKKLFLKTGMNVKRIPPKDLVIGNGYLEVTYAPLEGGNKTVQISILLPEEIVLAYDSLESFLILQIGYSMPFSPSEHTLKDTLKLISHFNESCLLPGFSYVENRISYRCAIPFSPNADPSEEMILGLFQTAVSLIEACEEVINKVALGKASYDKVVFDAQTQTEMDMQVFMPIPFKDAKKDNSRM
jgi:hypothetical protein